MGVQNLNVIIKSWTPSANNKFKRIIVDGTNLLFNKLSRYISQLRKQKYISDWNGVDLNIVLQTKYIIEQTLNDITNYINRLQRKFAAVEIFLVFDPKQTPDCIVSVDLANIYTDDDKLISNQYINQLLDKDEVDKKEYVGFKVKSDEQASRRKANDKTSFIMQTINNINTLQDVEPDMKLLLGEVFKQSYHYNNTHNLLSLSSVVKVCLRERFINKFLYIVEAENEADLVIKNIATNNVGFKSSLCASDTDVDTLVLSADTDYHILFADCPNVCVSTLDHSVIYNPFDGWNELLGDAYSYEAVFRISAFLGNDYTTHASIINIDKGFDDVLRMFNIDDRFDELKDNKRKKVYRIVKNVSKPEGFTPLELIDERIFNFSQSATSDKEATYRLYFKKYLLSCIVYKNWNIYSCEILDNNVDRLVAKNMVNDEMVKIIVKILSTYPIVFDWQSYNLSTNWLEFVKTVNVIQSPALDDKNRLLEWWESVELVEEPDYADGDDFV